MATVAYADWNRRLMTFWKEMMFYTAQALYQRQTGYTGTSLYENW